MLVYIAKNKQVSPLKITLGGDWQLVNGTFHENRLVILSTLRSSYRFDIFAIDSAKLIDSCWGMFAKLSPNGHYLAFTRWQGRSIPNDLGERVGETRIYDVTKSPQENRTSFGLAEMQRNPISVWNSSKDCGIPIYPIGNYNDKNYGWVQSIEQIQAPFSAYHWYKDNAFIFATAPHQQNRPTLVDITLPPAPAKPKVLTMQLDGKDYQLPNEPEAQPLAIYQLTKTSQGIVMSNQSTIYRIADFVKY